MSYLITGLLRLCHIVFGLYAWTTFVVFSLATIILVAITPLKSLRRRVAKATSRLVFRLTGTPLDVTGIENFPGGASVLVANHSSYIDGVLLTAVLPARFSFVIKGEMTRIPLVHFLLRRIGAEFVSRAGTSKRASDARRLLQLARDGESLAFFPEGTFVAEPGLLKFHSGAFVAAVRGKLPVVPVVIRGTRKMLPAGRLLPVPGRLAVMVKEPVHARALDDPAPKLLQLSRQSILENLDEPDLG